MRGGIGSSFIRQTASPKFFKPISIFITLFVLAVSGAACGGSEEDDEPVQVNDAGIVVVTDGGHGTSDAGPVDIDAGPVISDGGSDKCTQADQYCNTNDRNGMRCKNGEWKVWTCKAGTTCSRADNGYLSCVPDGEGDAGITITECKPGYFGKNCAPCTCKHGDCNDGPEGDGKCSECYQTYVSEDNFIGDNCDECAPGYYGPRCEKCNCLESQECSDGITGTGCSKCKNPLMTGDKCDVCTVADGTIGTLKDARDNNREYKTTMINCREWMAENWKIGSYYFPNGDERNVDTYGLLYT